MSGLNSILFDIDSIVDMELTVINYIATVYGSDIFDMGLYNKMDDEMRKMKRIFSGEDAFSILIKDPNYRLQYRKILDSILERDQEEIFTGIYPVKTDISALLSAYKRTGNGVIKYAVRCDNEYQKQYIQQLDRDIVVIVQQRDQVDTGKYGRIFIGNCIKGLEYKFNSPKSIVVLNFFENYDTATTPNQLIPEFIINFGDIHAISMASAYRTEIKG